MSGVTNSYEWLGLLAGALCVASTVPQLIGNLRQPSKIEVRTIVRNAILATGNLGWVVYGLLNHLISVPLFCGLNVLLLLVGCILDPLSAILLLTPLLMPTLKALNIDPIHFAIILTASIEIAAITPPVGFNLFVIQGLTGHNIFRIAAHALPFFLLLVAAVVLLWFLTTSDFRFRQMSVMSSTTPGIVVNSC